MIPMIPLRYVTETIIIFFLAENMMHLAEKEEPNELKILMSLMTKKLNDGGLAASALFISTTTSTSPVILSSPIQ